MIEFYTSFNGKAIKHDISPFFQFPGGEWDMKIEPGYFTGKEIAVVRGSDPNDYVQLALWASAVAKRGGHAHAVIPYLPAARADRGTPTGADIYADMIRLANVESVTVLDPHSQYMVDRLEDGKRDWVTRVSPRLIIRKNLEQFPTYDGVISPDAGSRERSRGIADVLDTDVYLAEKSRNFETGELSNFFVPINIVDGNRYLIGDDICDGGGTFNGLADAIHAKFPNVKLDLFVSHGIFSKGVDELFTRFDRIYTTNSLNLPHMPGLRYLNAVSELLKLV